MSETMGTVAQPAMPAMPAVAAMPGAVAPLPASASAAVAGLSGAQKAMLFLVSLDEEVATRVIANLREDEVTALRAATENLREVPTETLLGVHREFLSRVRAGLPTSLNGSGAYLRRLVGNALGEGRAAAIWEESPVDRGTPLMQLESHTLAGLLDAEHPQTVAVVMSQLDPARAAETLGRMSADRRADVIARLSKLSAVPEAALEEIEREFASHLARMGNERKRDIKGKDAAAGILKRLPAAGSEELLERLTQLAPETAEVLKQALFTFEDLLRVDGRGMQQLLKEVPTDQLVLALKTASEALREKVFGNLSSRAADMLREDLGLMGPQRVSDVEAAQRAIVDIALQLERDGRIQIAREGGGDYV